MTALQIDEQVLFELFSEAADVLQVNIPRDPETEKHNGYGFVEFYSEESAAYAFKAMNFVQLLDQVRR